ncbi:MAG: hypothetical protein LBB47_08235 [Spirochaetaceae bacterium]|jgi:hypothetical protein|nr:hypothetical protein [Spirochaetaceae bacterium]
MKKRYRQKGRDSGLFTAEAAGKTGAFAPELFVEARFSVFYNYYTKFGILPAVNTMEIVQTNGFTGGAPAGY